MLYSYVLHGSSGFLTSTSRKTVISCSLATFGDRNMAVLMYIFFLHGLSPGKSSICVNSWESWLNGCPSSNFGAGSDKKLSIRWVTAGSHTIFDKLESARLQWRIPKYRSSPSSDTGLFNFSSLMIFSTIAILSRIVLRRPTGQRTSSYRCGLDLPVSRSFHALKAAFRRSSFWKRSGRFSNTHCLSHPGWAAICGFDHSLHRPFRSMVAGSTAMIELGSVGRPVARLME